MILLALFTAYAGNRDDIVRPDTLSDWVTPGGSNVASEWWTTFDDPGFDRIMELALVRNRSLLSADASAAASRSAMREAITPLLPSVTFDASAQIAPTNSRGFQFGLGQTIPGQPEPPKTFWTGSAAFNAGWELDLFMKNAQQLRSSRFEALAVAGDRDAAILSLATSVANGYYDIVATKQRMALMERQIDAHETMMDLVESRYQAGDAQPVEVLQQRQLIASARAQLPLADATLASLKYQMAVALALPPATPVEGVAESLPDLPAPPDAGVPGDLIRNRPDLKAAEARIDSSSARKQNALRQLLPTFRVSGTAGWQAFRETETSVQTFWNAGISASVPIVGGRTVPQIQTARHQEAAAVHQYTQLAANAVVEVEQALVNENGRRLHLDILLDQVEAADLAWKEAQSEYLNGLGSYLTLLNARNTKDAAELAVIDSRRQLIGARIQVHDALGGAWTHAIAESLGDNR